MNKKQMIITWAGIAALVIFAIFNENPNLILVCIIAITVAAIYTFRTKENTLFSEGKINVLTKSEITLSAQVPPDTINLIQKNTQEKNYGGIGRLGYFLGMIGIVLIEMVLTSEAHVQDEPGILCILFVGSIITVAISLILTAGRLRNIGENGWLSLLMIIPLVSLFVGIPCLMLPEGYHDTKKFDTAGRVIAGIVIGVGALAVLSIIYILALMYCL